MDQIKRAASPYILNAPAGTGKAFTLPEILVVVLLISVVTSAIYSFYELGARAHKKALGRLESVSSMRFLQKLLSDKLSKKSENCYSAFLKKDGFAGLTGNQIENILSENLHAKNDPLYDAVGYAYYRSHAAGGITNISASDAAKKIVSSKVSMEKDFRGAYLYEATKEAAVAPGELFNFSFDRAPSKVFGASFLGAGKSAVISTNASESTAELNVGDYIDLNSLIGPSPPVNPSFSVNIKSGTATIANLFHVFFFFDSDAPPSASLSPNITSEEIKKYFIESAGLYCGDGIMFYETDSFENYVNHAIYVHTPPAGEADYDPDGNILKTLRYAFSHTTESGKKIYDEVIVKNLSEFNFVYYGKNGDIIEPARTGWKWAYAPQISFLSVEAVSSKDGIKSPVKMTFQFYTQY
ncbi:MAG: hypothetical protein BWY32_02681 [bacterium ADurb.Bin243]|nr:MAG: hypothetical protein BWY32_02681 [bacterium ADurb.Bin243]